ncbi:MAG: hypothetical protein NT062_39505 [Proteobacteria bacterium]|nr:hypothetical protein [Pseudomonadota bacterium]
MSAAATHESPESGEQGPRRKHRHDLGHEDHGSKLAAGTTKAIQVLLGMWIAATCGLVVYALVDATRARPTTDATPTSTVQH